MTSTGAKAAITVERISYRQCLTPVRAFYLDLAQWASRNQPVGRMGRSLSRRRGRDQPAQGRPAPQVTHGRAPGTTPRPARPGPGHRRAAQNAEALLQAARQAHPGETFTTAGQTLTGSDHIHDQREDLGR